MASKRRKAYRGTEQEHRSKAARNIRDMRFMLRKAKSQLKDGSCQGAFLTLLAADGAAHMAVAEMGWAKHWGVQGMGRSKVLEATRKLKREFQGKCVRG